MPFQYLHAIEPGTPVRTDSIAGQKRYSIGFQFLGHPVIHRMPGFHIMVSDAYGIISHIGSQARKQMRRQRIHVIEIISGIVPLETIACVHEKDIVLSQRIAVLIDISIDGHQRVLHLPADVCRIEPRAVYIIGSQEIKLKFAARPIYARHRRRQNRRHGRQPKFIHIFQCLYSEDFTGPGSGTAASGAFTSGDPSFAGRLS